jgi:hypothetical protein
VGIGPSAELERRHEGRYVKAEPRIDALDVPELVRVREVLAVPGEKEVALVVRGDRQVKGVSDRIAWWS